MYIGKGRKKVDSPIEISSDISASQHENQTSCGYVQYPLIMITYQWRLCNHHMVNPLNAKTIYICSRVPVSQREDHIYMSRAASVR